MSLKKLSIALMAAAFSTLSFAEVPALALTFKTNVKAIGATTAQAAKLAAAAHHVQRVVRSQEFKDAVSSFSFNYNRGMTGAQIYQNILDGNEDYKPEKNNTMDLEVEFYRESSNVVGYADGNNLRIHMNTYFFDDYTAEEVSHNMIHEWMHKKGFSHQFYNLPGRSSTVPYKIGSIQGSLALKHLSSDEPSSGDQVFVGATNLKLSVSGTTLKLTWTAASAPAGIQTYKVFRRVGTATTNTLQKSTTLLTFSQTVPTASAVYYVRAVDNNGDTVKSAEVKYTK